MTALNDIDEIATECVSCNLCVKECAYLQKYGTPGKICNAFLAGIEESDSPVFSCNLCGLCQVVCPQNLDCSAAFLEIRRTLQKSITASAKNRSVYNEHNSLCKYEARGASPLFSLHLFPEGCDSIFFPGCTLAATRSSITESVYHSCKKVDPRIGIVLDCCMRPSHDLGLQGNFDESFTQLTDHLKKNNIKRIFTACPSCYATFQAYAADFETCSIYEWLAENLPPTNAFFTGTVTIHDTCVSRSATKIHDAVRTLVARTGAGLEEMKHNRERALCCGEGAAAAFVAPALTAGWRAIRKRESSGRRVITYCAGCSHTLGKEVPTTHLLDLLFDSENATQGKEKISKAPFTYIHRLLLKHRLKKAEETARVIGRASITARSIASTSRFTRIAVVALLLITFGLQLLGVNDWFDASYLQNLLDRFQGCPPVFYIAAFAVAPLFFLPATPFVLAAGLLYGKVWGLAYAMTGATLGATVAFLVARYVSAGFVADKLTGPQWVKLQTNVEKHGWKAVAAARLIPLFPYNLVNYAFGMTRIKFSHYLVATGVFMLPSCVAFIVFSSSFLDLLKGCPTKDFGIGLLLILSMSVLPVFYTKFLKKG